MRPDAHEIAAVFAAWDRARTHGMRSPFEVLPAEDLDGLRREVLVELAARRSDAGIPMTHTASVVRTEKRAR